MSSTIDSSGNSTTSPREPAGLGSQRSVKAAAPAPPPAVIEEEMIQCAMCKNTFAKPACVEVKSRFFCGPCHAKFLAQVEARKKQLAGKS